MKTNEEKMEDKIFKNILSGDNVVKVSYFDDRWYKVIKNNEEKYYPSVTTILGIIEKYGLDRWRGDVGNREADIRMVEAQNKGKRIHHAWEIYNLGGSVGIWSEQIEERPNYDFVFLNQEEYIDFLKLVEFLQVTDAKVISSEQTVFDHEFEEAGTLDDVLYIKEGKYLINGKNPVELKEGLYIADVKTGNAVYEEAYYQVASYAVMFEKIENKPITGCLIMHTGANLKNGIYGFATKVITREEVTEYYNIYRKAADIWKFKNKEARPKQFDFPKFVKKAVKNEK